MYVAEKLLYPNSRIKSTKICTLLLINPCGHRKTSSNDVGLEQPADAVHKQVLQKGRKCVEKHLFAYMAKGDTTVTPRLWCASLLLATILSDTINPHPPLLALH